MTETGLTKTQERVITVLERMANEVAKNERFATSVRIEMDSFLLEVLSYQWLKPEDDPRGDMRNGNWSMDRVEGIDK